jgi:hypothetical protein
MSATDFRLTDSTRAVFMFARGTVQFYFLVDDKQVGKNFLYTQEEAAVLGGLIFKTASWDECPVTLLTSDLRNFGQRLRDYAIQTNDD